MTDTKIEELALEIARITMLDLTVFPDDGDHMELFRKHLIDECLPIAVELHKRKLELTPIENEAYFSTECPTEIRF